MRVTWLDFHNHDKNWAPDDPWDCEFWVTADIGDEDGAVFFDIHVCTHTAAARLQSKTYCFFIEEYLGPQRLIDQLDKFIAERTRSVSGDPYWELGRIWRWEYGKYDQHGRLIV